MSKRTFDYIPGVEVCAGEMNVAFPIEEYKNRLTKIREIMDRKNIDFLYATAPESMNYISGYNVVWHRVNSPEEWYDSMGAGTAIHADHDKFIHFDLPDEEGALKLTSISTDTRFIYDIPADMYGKSYMCTTEDQGYKEIVVKNLKEEGWIKSGMTIGMEFGSYRPSYLIFDQWKTLFEAEGCKVIDATSVIREARSIKSKLELQYIETATKICDIGMQAIYDAIEPGITELEIAGAYTQAQYKAGGEIQAIGNMVRSGPNRSWCFHIPASRRKIMMGDPIGVDLAGVYNRYHSNQCRYFSLGEPPKEFAKKYSVNKNIIEMVKNSIKPNMLISDLLCDLRGYIKEEGLWGEQYWIGGYELGIAFPPDWCGGSTVYDIYFDCDNKERRFVPGTVVNIETGFGCIDTLMFKEDEAIVLGKTTRELMIKEF